MRSLIVGENIVKSYGTGDERRHVLDGVTVQIDRGEFVSVMGPSGSGKSTLLFCLSGMDGVDGGKVAFEGRELLARNENELADMRRTKMGFIFQQPTLLKHLNVLDNIILPSMRGKRTNTADVLEKARALMKRTGITELESRDITQVSGGQLQRAGICRALMNNPSILFGDEPTGALNSQAAHEIMNVLTEIHAQGTAILLVTHDVHVAARAQRVLFMRDGKIVSEIKLPTFSGIAATERISKVTEKMREIGI